MVAASVGEPFALCGTFFSSLSHCYLSKDVSLPPMHINHATDSLNSSVGSLLGDVLSPHISREPASDLLLVYLFPSVFLILF